jgi:hypothetical protein
MIEKIFETAGGRQIFDRQGTVEPVHVSGKVQA